jgi:hypothetical protein
LPGAARADDRQRTAALEPKRDVLHDHR